MISVDYESWAHYVKTLAEKHGGRYKSVLDLACGTGSSALPFARQGIFTTGIDLSPAMIEKALEKSAAEKLKNTEFFVQDLCQLKLPRLYDLAVLFQDGLNYLIGAEKLALAFKNVYRMVKPGGLFIFDLTRPALRPGSLNRNTEMADDDNFTMFWESDFCANTRTWSVKLIVFRLRKAGLYEKFYEEHQEQDYPPDQVTSLLKEEGFSVLGLYPSFSLKPLEINADFEAKLTFVARRPPGQ